MEESVDVKALRARFINNQASTSASSSRDSGSPKSPRPGFGKSILPVTENNLALHRLSPTIPPHTMAGPGPLRFPKAEPTAASIPSRPAFPPRAPFNPGIRAAISPVDNSNVRQTGEILQNMMLRHQRPPGPKPGPGPGPGPAPPLPPPAPTTPQLRQQPRQKSTGDVTPLRRPLPPEGPLPLKPRRPPNVNLEPFRRTNRGPALPGPRRQDGSPVTPGRKMSIPAVANPPKPPQRSNKPNLPHQLSMDIDDTQEPYDDVGSFEKSESWSDNSSQCLEADDDEVYEAIDEDQVEVNRANAEKKNKKEAKKQREQEKKEQLERQKKENDLKKNFQLQGEVEVLHTARVRHDWSGGKLDLSVREGESVEIVRVKNNPGGKWLARSLNGTYGYISNTCVDVDYEAVKRKLLQTRKIDTSPLPPPPPDPPQMTHVDFNNRDNSTLEDDDDDYDDVQPIPDDFPPPPPEISIDPKAVKELKKKFKYNGPLTVLHVMMVDPNCVIKKPGTNYLHVTNGEILDVIQLTNDKKALCRNQFGKYGYVPRAHLLPLEGDVYDDVDYLGDVYDNDSLH